MSRTHNAGIVTAYGAAVRGGYVGTYEEFCAQQAQYAENARQMEQAVSDARQIKTSVESAVSEAEGYADDANQSATNASNSATQASQSASNANQSANNASSSADSASQSASSAQTSANNASTSEQNAHQSAEDAHQSVEDAQDILESVQTEGNTQIGRVQAKGNEIIDSLPDDFTEIQNELNALKADLADDRNGVDDYKLKGLAYYGLMSTFVSGSLGNNGVVHPNYKYRVSTEAVQHNTTPIDIADIDSTFFIRIIYFTDSTATEVASASNVLQKDCPYRIPSGSYFRFFIRRATENTSEIADIATFRKAVRIANYLDEYLDDESPKLSSYFYDSMENAYIDSNGVVQANATSALSDWIKVKAGDKIKYKLMGGKTAYLFVLCSDKFVNANSIVYGLLGAGYGVYESLYVTGEYIVPSDGYMRYSYHIEYCTDGYFYVENALQTESAVRLNILEDTVNAPIPSYWETPINTAEATYLAHIKSSSPNLVSFPFITDVHWGRNAKHSPRLINRLCRDLGMSFVVIGGDIETATEETADECTAITNDFLRRFNKPLFTTIGNHDNNSDKTVDENIIVTSGTLYDSFYRPYEQYVNTDGERNGYYDIPSHKTRIIAIDTGTPIWYKGQNIGTDYNYQRLENSIDWAYSKISELDSTWHVILVTHIIWGGAPVDKTPTMQSWVTNRLKTGILDKSYSAEIVALFCGHLHRDIDGTLTSTDGTKTLLIVGTTTDNYNLSSKWGGPTMTVGTATEQAFDLVHVDLDNKNIYMTRVGAGNSRSFSYE